MVDPVQRGRWLPDPETGERVWASPRPRVYLSNVGPVVMGEIEAKMAELIDRCDDDLAAYEQAQAQLAEAEKAHHRFVLLKMMELRTQTDEATGKPYAPTALKQVVDAYALDLWETVTHLEAQVKALSKSLDWVGHQKDMLQTLAANQRAAVNQPGRH